MNKDFPTPQNFEERFSQELLKRSVRALLLGGVACITYGSTRYSQDTDWWIDSTPDVRSWIRIVMDVAIGCGDPCVWTRLLGRQKLGSYPQDAGSDDMLLRVEQAVAEDGVVRIGTKDSFVDAFYRPHRLTDFAAAWRRSRVLDGCLRRLCIEDLIQTKTGTGRPQDKDDVRFLTNLLNSSKQKKDL